MRIGECVAIKSCESAFVSSSIATISDSRLFGESAAAGSSKI